MSKEFFIILGLMLIACVYIAGCSSSSSSYGSDLDSSELRQLYESGLPVPDNRPFYDKDHNCVVFQNGRKAICTDTDKTRVMIDEKSVRQYAE